MQRGRLLLLAQDASEVPLLSALTQSAIVRSADIAYDRRARRLVLMLSRYRWEAPGTRVRTALRIESVTSVRRRGGPAWSDRGSDDPGVTMLELLAFTFDDGFLTLDFAGGAALRVAVECPDLALEDLSPPWRAGREPRHG